MTPATAVETLATEASSEGAEPDDDFVDFLARRLGVEPAEARHRLSDFLVRYEPESRPRPKTLPLEPPAE